MAVPMDASTGTSEENRFARQYVLEEKAIGEGTYGAVYKGRCTQSGRLIAVKKMKPVHEEEGVPSTAIREVAVLKNADHPNIVKLLDVYCALGKIHVVFEFIDQNLKEYMRKVGAAPVQGSTGPLSQTTCCNFHGQLTKGTHFLHSHRIIHRDLKPQNVLVSNDLMPILKICDFGMARAYSMPLPKYTHEVVTTWYRAPEILFGSELYSLPIDMWSLGCILGEMASGSALFRGDCEIDTIFKIFQKLGTPTEAEWPGLNSLPDYKLTFPKWQRKPWSEINRGSSGILGRHGIALIDELLRYDPRRRISARMSLSHPYLTQDSDVAMADFVLS